MLVAMTVTGGYWFTSSTFFANPAVTLAKSLTDTFVGIAPVDIIGFVSASGVEPTVIEYVKTSPSREDLLKIIIKTGGNFQVLIREKGTPYTELDLNDLSLSDVVLIEAMMQHLILINRPIVIAPKGVRLCRPS